MRLAVVILNWNGEAFLRRFLPGVIACSTGEEAPEGCEVTVVVADNGSTDGSVRWLEEAYVSVGNPWVRLLAFDENYGFTGGYNRILAHESLASFDAYLLLNSDVEVTSGWLEPLAALFEAEPTVGAAMPKLRAYDRRAYFEYAGAAGGFIDRLGYPFCRGRIFGTVERDEGQYDTVRDVFWATGAALLVRAEVWRQAGGFEEVFFAHMEEIDLCWRMRIAGRRVRIVPRSTVYHLGGGTLKAQSPAKVYFNHRNNLAMLFKCAPAPQRLLTAVVRPPLDALAALSYLAQGRWRNFCAVGRAWWWFLRHHRELARARRRIQATRRAFAGTYIYQGSVVLRYLAGRRTFGRMM